MCAAKILSRSCLSWVKTRISDLGAHVSFRRVQTLAWRVARRWCAQSALPIKIRCRGPAGQGRGRTGRGARASGVVLCRVGDTELSRMFNGLFGLGRAYKKLPQHHNFKELAENVERVADYLM